MDNSDPANAKSCPSTTSGVSSLTDRQEEI